MSLVLKHREKGYFFMKQRYPVNPSISKGRRKKVPIRLRKQLDTLVEEVTWLNSFDDLFVRFATVINDSKINRKNGAFANYLHWALPGELVHRVVRVTESQSRSKKRSKKVITLYTFLEELQRYHGLINRENYLGIKPNTCESYLKSQTDRDKDNYHRLNKEFDRYVGKKFFSIPKKQIERDMRNLKKITKRITLYRHKHLAHLANGRSRIVPPKFKEVHDAVKVIVEITKKYYLLINCSSHAMKLPGLNIEGLFKKPWIDNDKK